MLAKISIKLEHYKNNVSKYENRFNFFFSLLFRKSKFSVRSILENVEIESAGAGFKLFSCPLHPILNTRSNKVYSLVVGIVYDLIESKLDLIKQRRSWTPSKAYANWGERKLLIIISKGKNVRRKYWIIIRFERSLENIFNVGGSRKVQCLFT